MSGEIERAIALLRDAVPDVDYVEVDDEMHRCISCDTSARQVAEALEILRGLP